MWPQKFKVYDETGCAWLPTEYILQSLLATGCALEHVICVPFTGKCDKNRQEIYAGHCLMYDGDMYTVEWDNERACWFGRAKAGNFVRGSLCAESFPYAVIYDYDHEYIIRNAKEGE